MTDTTNSATSATPRDFGADLQRLSDECARLRALRKHNLERMVQIRCSICGRRGVLVGSGKNILGVCSHLYSAIKQLASEAVPEDLRDAAMPFVFGIQIEQLPEKELKS
jgi:hypothetical protein